jgi:hypothetical protein
MTRERRLKTAAVLLAVAAILGYLRDPAWIGGVTSGMRPWEQDLPGTLFRWTMGRATFYVPSNATLMTLPLRSVFPGPNGSPVRVDVRDDGMLVATVDLAEPDAWVRQMVPLSRYTGTRRFRRIDLHVSRVLPPYDFGVITGEVSVR